MEYPAGAETWLRVVIKDAEGNGVVGLAYDDPGLVIRYQQHGGPVVIKTLAADDWSEAVEGTYAVRFSTTECSVAGDFVHWASYTGAITYEGLVRLTAARSDDTGEDDEIAGTELEQATVRLTLWRRALDACASGQHYQVGRTQLSRVDVDKCRRMVRYYESEVERLTRGGRRGARVMRVVPQDN